MTRTLPDTVRPLALATPEELTEYRAIIKAARQAVLRSGGPPIQGWPSQAADRQSTRNPEP
jgi:hypothetical protein